MEGIAESHTWRRDRAPIKNVLYISNVGTNVVSCLEVEQYYRVNWDQAQNAVPVITREGQEVVFTARYGFNIYLVRRRVVLMELEATAWFRLRWKTRHYIRSG